MKRLNQSILAVVALIVSFTLPSIVHAKRYVVSVKSKETYQAIRTQYQSFKQFQTMSFGKKKEFFLMGSKAKVAKTLDKVEMIIVDTNKPETLNALKRNPAILAVEEEFFYPVPKPLLNKRPLSAVPTMLGRKVDMPWGIEAVRAPEAWDIAGDGDGVKVLVLDTGIDHDHPDLVDNFEDGRNFVPRFSDTDRTKAPYDYFDEVGHGTHVAGTILASGKGNGLLGVASGATLLMGRVCSNSCSSIAIIEGVNWGIAEGVSVISMSLGGALVSRTEREAYKKAEDAGVMIVAAAGNDGVDKISYPAAISTVLSVGAVDDTLSRAEFSQYGKGLDVVAPGVDILSSVPLGSGSETSVKVDLGNGLEKVESKAFQGSTSDEIPTIGTMVYVGLGKEKDFANVKVRNKVALISRGELPFAEKVENAIANGAKAVLMFNNTDGLIRGGLTDDGSSVGIPVIMIEQEVGESLVKILDSGDKPMASMATLRTDYSALQGTSMATPHVAGVAALVIAANPELTPEEVREVIKSTCEEAGDEWEYGAGMVNAEAAVEKARGMSTAGMLAAGF